MLLSASGRDAASQAALRMLMKRLPGLSAIDGASSVEPPSPMDPPALRAAKLVEGNSLRAIRVGEPDRAAPSGFGGFLDGTQRVQVVADLAGIPIVYGTAAAAVRIRINRRMVTWVEQPPRVERKLFIPLRNLSELLDDPTWAGVAEPGIVDTSKPDERGSFASAHPTALLDLAIRAVYEMRERLENELAQAWCTSADDMLFIDGGIGANQLVASSARAIGVIKSHRTLYAEGSALRTVFGLARGERSSVFQISPRTRSTVLSWYLRVRDPHGHDAMWGLVRVEAAEGDRPSERADEISRWVMAEMSPLSLPDSRWDKMAYGVRDTEEFLRAIA